MKEKTIIKSITIPESLYLKIKDSAKKEYRSETSMIRLILTKYFEEGNTDANN